jgi:arylsulfatase A-like enzyme
VTVPANTTAEVRVPAREAAAVTEGGRPAATAPGVKFVRMDAGAAVFEVGSAPTGSLSGRDGASPVARRATADTCPVSTPVSNPDETCSKMMRATVSKDRRCVFAALLGVARAGGGGRPPAPRPNVVLILSDDQGWTDYGFMGHPSIRTPHLDRLAAESLLFTRGYTAAPLCRPALASLITGRHVHEHRIAGNDITRVRRNEQAGVPRYEAQMRHIEAVPTLPRLLAANGYRCMQTGKWWEGAPARGGFTEGMTHGDPARGGRHGDEGLQIGRGAGLAPIAKFLDDVAASSTPFFLWYAPMLPHSPHDPPAALLAHYRSLTNSESVARYWANCERFDATCGELLALLEARGLRTNTIVFYTCDNGWISDPARRDRFAPRSKNTPYEGGIRTPVHGELAGPAQPAAGR